MLRPAIAPSTVFTFIALLALADAIRALGLQPTVKWPNDVLVKGGKVAGVRAELVSRGDELDHAILGVGINVNVTAAALLAALGEAGQAATSLARAARPAGRPERVRRRVPQRAGRVATRSTGGTARRRAGAPGAIWTSSRGAASRSARGGSASTGGRLG
jgi:biotin-(acetyl-CoA carboxylase) ligase